MTPERLKATFDVFWPQLKDKLDQLPDEGSVLPRRDPSDMIEEILLAVRSIKRISESQVPTFNEVLRALLNDSPDAERLRRIADAALDDDARHALDVIRQRVDENAAVARGAPFISAK